MEHALAIRRLAPRTSHTTPRPSGARVPSAAVPAVPATGRHPHVSASWRSAPHRGRARHVSHARGEPYRVGFVRTLVAIRLVCDATPARGNGSGTPPPECGGGAAALSHVGMLYAAWLTSWTHPAIVSPPRGCSAAMSLSGQRRDQGLASEQPLVSEAKVGGGAIAHDDVE